MRIVFMGTPDFAVASLKKIHESEHEVVAVVTVPDRPAGRGRKLRPSAVKAYAESQNLEILQPEKLRDEHFLEQLKSFQADLFVVVAFRMLPEVVWNMPAKGTINLHGSLLPQYRGAAPINWAIINGEEVSGVTTFFINENIDTGDLIMKKELAILKEDTAGSYHDKLMEVGADLLLETLDAIARGQAPRTPQRSPAELKKAPKIFKEDTRIEFDRPLSEVYNFIRGLSPYPAAMAMLRDKDDEKQVKLLEVEMETSSHNIVPGRLLVEGKDTLKVAVQGGYIVVKKLQVQGKKAMDTAAWLNGHRPSEEATLR